MFVITSTFEFSKYIFENDSQLHDCITKRCLKLYGLEPDHILIGKEYAEYKINSKLFMLTKQNVTMYSDYCSIKE
jgi:hypothetical protein